MEHTRPIMWNVDDPVTKIAMYGLFVIASAICAWGIYGRFKVWRRGTAARLGAGGGLSEDSQAPPINEPLGQVLARLARHILAQVRIARVPWAYASHMMIFYGFIVLFIGTVIVALEHYGIFGLFGITWTGRFYDVTSWLLDLFGAGFVIALVIAMLRRTGALGVKPSSKPIDAAILWLFLIIGVTGFVVEALRVLALDDNWEKNVSFIGYAMAAAMRGAGTTVETATTLHFGFWWLHMVLVMVFIAIIPYTKLLHFLVAPAHIAISKETRSGRFQPVSLEEVEETGRFGLAKIEEFPWRRLLSYDACTQCRRCESACPAWNTHKPLSPMRVVLDIAEAGHSTESLHGDVISAETLWSCTTCGACVHHCPVLIDQMGTIVEMRRHLVGEGAVLGSAQGALRSIAATGNPWGLPAEDRAAWSEGLDVPTTETQPSPDVLLWVGCAGSYDRRNQQVSRALAKILRAAGVDFAIMGKKESCTGDPARRLGDEFTFLEQATKNVDHLSRVKFNRVVTSCAHCFNTLKNEYPDFGGEYHVLHHTELIQELVEQGKLPVDALKDVPAANGGTTGPVVLHDPCYLSRHNDGGEAARGALASVSGPQLPILEAAQCGKNTFCCGAGGGRMFMEEDIDKRVNIARWEQLKSTGAKTVATACPFCMTMLDDASKQDEEAGIAVRDVAELVAERLTASTP
ncbi:MAG: 4Fe-4S dicluster domain-containing protein [Pirellulales bacterium]|nr:4Fe-4S dicluster domain-containing protein [Pirellulales bacterium]